jgi:hypothetical protein
MATTISNPFEILQNKWYIWERSSTYKEATLSIYICVLWKFEKVQEKWIKKLKLKPMKKQLFKKEIDTLTFQPIVSWIRNNTWKAQRLTRLLMKRSG